MSLEESENIKPRVGLRKILLIVFIVVLILAICGFVWWYFRDKKIKEDAQKAEIKAIASEGCGEIVTEDGKTEGMAPWAPVVKAKITGDFPKDTEICHWIVNGEDLGKYKPYGDYCVLYDLDLIQLGYYKVVFTVDGLKNCPKEKILKVTSLDEKETLEQAEIIKKIEAGATVEEIELLESHKIRKY